MKEIYENTIGYYNRIAQAYSESTAAVVQSTQIDNFLSRIPQWGSIIDVACWPWHDTEYFCRNWFQCRGIDGSKEMIRIAEKRLSKYPNVSLKVQNVLDITDEDTFDGAWCSSILVHLDKEDIDLFLRRIRQSLKIHGVIWVITTKQQQRIPKPGDTRKYSMYTEDELHSSLQSVGFQTVDSCIMNYWSRERIFLLAHK